MTIYKAKTTDKINKVKRVLNSLQGHQASVETVREAELIRENFKISLGDSLTLERQGLHALFPSSSGDP